MGKAHPIKVGKGVKAQVALECFSYPNRGGSETYGIRHALTGYVLGNGYLYLSIARTIAKSLAESLSLSLLSTDREVLAGLFTPTMRDYLEYYSLRDTKVTLPLEEFAHGSDYEQFNAQRRAAILAVQQEAEYMQELCERDISVCYVAHPGGATPGYTLEPLVRGDPIPGESFPSYITEDVKPEYTSAHPGSATGVLRRDDSTRDTTGGKPLQEPHSEAFQGSYEPQEPD